MKISFYGYSVFLIESGDNVIAIDPGGLFFTFSDSRRLSPNPSGPELLIFLSLMAIPITTGMLIEWQSPLMPRWSVTKP
jgi:hypothetical protein